jgi:SAM-dependent methyltransferase
MRKRALDYLACPQCAGDLMLSAEETRDDHIETGRLFCPRCRVAYPIERGVPRFARDVDLVEQETAEAFGYEWTRYSELADRYRRQFLDWIRPVDASFFEGRTVLEGGCGKGRHTALAASFGAKDVVAVDLSQAVDAAYANTRHLPNVHIVQADLKNAPVKRRFDYAFSVGVLHHLPHPEDGFRALVSKLVPGGHVSAWVYGREGNGWIVHGVTPVREHVTSRMPHAVLDALAAAITVPLFAATRLVYGPSGGRLLGRRLPYGEYLSYIAPFPFREQRSIVFDHLVAPVAHYIARDEFDGWFERAGLDVVSIEQHNANSWRGFARVPAEAAA